MPPLLPCGVFIGVGPCCGWTYQAEDRSVSQQPMCGQVTKNVDRGRAGQNSRPGIVRPLDRL